MLQKKIIHITSFLLLLIFSVIQFAGILHAHPEFASAKQTLSVKGDPDTTQVCKSTLKCKICELVVHKHQYELPFSPVFVFQVKILSATTYTPSNCDKLFDNAVNCWTNKGPPVLS